MKIGEKIKSLRNQKGITQKELADELHVAFQTISKWERDENEPDIATLKELAKIFDCTVDCLINDNESVEENKKPSSKEETPTVIVQPKETHYCEYCNKPILDNDDLVMQDVEVTPALRGRCATYRQAFYHKECLETLEDERNKRLADKMARKVARVKKRSFVWATVAGIFAFIITLLILLINEEARTAVSPSYSWIFALLSGYAFFSLLYCLVSCSYILNFFATFSKLTIRWPVLIFSLDLDGIIWLITVKLIFAIIGFILGACVFILALIVSIFLSIVSFPFVLIYNNKTDYQNAVDFAL